MKKINLSIAVILMVFLGCSGSNKISVWKTQDTYPVRHNKLLVVGIVKDSFLRRQMEEHFAGDLKNLGYLAVTALDQFGLKGLSQLSEEETYIKLCGEGIDAVITFVLIDETKERLLKAKRFNDNLNSLYYRRIWNYLSMRSDEVYFANNNLQTHLFWEAMLFDLSTLQPVYLARTKSFASVSAEGLAHEYGKAIVANMVKNRVLNYQNISPAKHLRPF